MPAFVIASKCKNNSKCVEICPGDVMRVDPETNRAYNMDPDMCWECASCLKACPEHAIEIRPYADISPLGSEIRVIRNDKTNTIRWTIKYRDSRRRGFQFPIRTTQWDTITIPVDLVDEDLLKSGESLSNENCKSERKDQALSYRSNKKIEVKPLRK